MPFAKKIISGGSGISKDDIDKINKGIEDRFNALTSKQQQDAEVIDARDGETSLKARLDRDIEKAKQVYVNVEGNHISTDSSVGYLRDIEVLGNTIQDAENLADIRSVGDKVEGQELYEIPVVSCGKNICSGEKLYPKSISIISGELVEGASTVVDFYEVKPNTIYTTSINGTNRATNVFYYDRNKEFLYKDEVVTHQFTTPSNAKYVRHYYGTNGEESLIQTEEGTQATLYEPYQEDKLTILSPVQLEKVGDVADRMICKDGVWGVEKNIETYYPNINKLSNYTIIGNSFRISSNSADVLVTPIKPRSICNLLAEGASSDWSIDKQCAYVLTNNTIVIKGDISNANDTIEARNWVKSSGLFIKYPTTQPTFIPLPHDQQIALRTFANKTHISFDTEIEPTIKAQVPKSLGATVNIHTEQINNLNKELDRVKKLEESTVSTVTTESDFTTVEATSNGYFEDVKLEGKTLVNICTHKEPTLINGTELITQSMDFKLNTTYTIIFTSDKIANRIEFTFRDRIGSNYYTEKTTTTVNSGLNIIKLHILSNIANIDGSSFYIAKRGEDECTISNIVLLEGDHTQNPPSYFEGLKSVGQDVEEVSVASVNENLWNNGRITIGKDDIVPKNANAYVYLEEGSYSLSAKYTSDTSSDYLRFSVKRSNYSGEVIQTLTQINKVFTIPSNGIYYIAVDRPSSLSGAYTSADIMLKKENTVTTYKPHKSNKKPLLYYNPTTQTWEKPILRQWDSIEKHADGKYYYHQRSGEVVLNGNEFWELRPQSDSQDVIAFNGSGLTTSSNVLGVVCDKFSTIEAFGEGANFENVFIATSMRMQIRVLKSRLTTQDVAGFKQWLQANNVTVVYQLAEEKVYECTNIDLITYANETNYVIESGVLSPRTTLKVHNNISNIVRELQIKVSTLEGYIQYVMLDALKNALNE